MQWGERRETKTGKIGRMEDREGKERRAETVVVIKLGFIFLPSGTEVD